MGGSGGPGVAVVEVGADGGAVAAGDAAGQVAAADEFVLGGGGPVAGVERQRSGVDDYAGGGAAGEDLGQQCRGQHCSAQPEDHRRTRRGGGGGLRGRSGGGRPARWR